MPRQPSPPAARPAIPSAARRVIAARAISRVGGEAGFFVGVWGTAAYKLDATPGSLAMLMAALAIATLIGSSIAGVLVDRFGPKRVLLGGEILFVPAILTLITAGSMTAMTVRAPLAWLAGALVLTAVTSFPPALAADPQVIERTNSLMEAAATVAFVLGPVLGSITVQLFDLAAVFILDAATSVIAVALIVGVTVRPVAATERRSGRRELVDGLRYAYGTPTLRTLLLLGTLTWVSFGMFGALEPLFFRDVLGTGPEALGYVNSLFGVGLFAGAVTLDRSAGRMTSVRAATALTGACSIGVLLYVGTARLPVVLLGAVVWGTLLGALMPLLRTLVHLHTAEGYVGRVMGTYNAQHSAAELVPIAIAPALAAALGVQPVLLGMGLVLAIGAPLAWPTARRIDRLRPVSPPPDRHLIDRIEDLEEHVSAG